MALLVSKYPSSFPSRAGLGRKVVKKMLHFGLRLQ